MKAALDPTVTELAALKNVAAEPIENQSKQYERHVQYYFKLYDHSEYPGIKAVLHKFAIFVKLDAESTEGGRTSCSNNCSIILVVPSVDGIPAKIFKVNNDVRLQLMHAMLLKLWRQRNIQRLQHAQIVTLCKKWYDKGDCNNYSRYLFLRHIRNSHGFF